MLRDASGGEGSATSDCGWPGAVRACLAGDFLAGVGVAASFGLREFADMSRPSRVTSSELD
jgi:hypothetical protein